mgnify:FL=1
MTSYPPREDRIGSPPMCDKAWHCGGEPVPATRVLRCADCGRVYARCAQCNRGGSTVEISMRAHRWVCHRGNAGLRQRVLPGREA